MRRLYIVVEGATEERFCKQVLAPHFLGRGIYLWPMQIRRGGGARGGGRSWQPWARHLRTLLKQHRGPDVQVSTMLDLYGVPRDTPGFDPEMQGAALVDALVVGVRRQLPDRRLLPYFQRHEFEALVFSDVDAFALLGVGEQTRAALRAEAAPFDSPEAIDQGYETAPSRRIRRHVPRYDKVAHGTDLTRAIGLPRLRAACPGFDEWLSTLGG